VLRVVLTLCGQAQANPIIVMGRLVSALVALAAAVVVAQLSQRTLNDVAFGVSSVDASGDAPLALLGTPAAGMKAVWSSIGLGKEGGRVAVRLGRSAAADSAVAPSPAAEVPEAPHHHDPLITYYLSATGLQLRAAAPEQWPATHVVRLPLSGLAPLLSATYMPSEIEQLSSRGYETYMVRTVEFFKVSGPSTAASTAVAAGPVLLSTIQGTTADILATEGTHTPWTCCIFPAG
jgi:hypothetical protein